jgi:hypothetical protein
VAALYLPRPSQDSAEVLGEIAVEEERFLALLRQARQVPAGTRIRLDYAPGRGTTLVVEDRHLGRIPGEAFNRALLRIWLGSEPIQPSFKRALLGGATSL